MMCMKKKTIFLIALLVVFLFSFFKGFGLVKLSDRGGSENYLTKRIEERIRNECKFEDPEKCALYAMKLTCELLRFTEKNDIENGRANCIGYASLCSQICNYALRQNGFSNKAKHVVGYVSFYGLNLCDILKFIAPKEYKNFVKDHDFVELDLDDRVKYFDASLYDYCIDCTTYKNK